MCSIHCSVFVSFAFLLFAVSKAASLNRAESSMQIARDNFKECLKHFSISEDSSLPMKLRSIETMYNVEDANIHSVTVEELRDVLTVTPESGGSCEQSPDDPDCWNKMVQNVEDFYVKYVGYQSLLVRVCDVFDEFDQEILMNITNEKSLTEGDHNTTASWAPTALYDKFCVKHMRTINMIVDNLFPYYGSMCRDAASAAAACNLDGHADGPDADDFLLMSYTFSADSDNLMANLHYYEKACQRTTVASEFVGLQSPIINLELPMTDQLTIKKMAQLLEKLASNGCEGEKYMHNRKDAKLVQEWVDTIVTSINSWETPLNEAKRQVEANENVDDDVKANAAQAEHVDQLSAILTNFKEGPIQQLYDTAHDQLELMKQTDQMIRDYWKSAMKPFHLFGYCEGEANCFHKFLEWNPADLSNPITDPLAQSTALTKYASCKVWDMFKSNGTAHDNLCECVISDSQDQSENWILESFDGYNTSMAREHESYDVVNAGVDENLADHTTTE